MERGMAKTVDGHRHRRQPSGSVCTPPPRPLVYSVSGRTHVV